MFNLSSKITFLDEVGIYTITKVLSEDSFVVEDEHGFDRNCHINEISLFEENAFDGVEIETYENRNVKTNPFSKSGKKTINIPVIDLHIEHLMDNHRHMANHEIVMFQLDVCQRELDRHIKKGTTQLVIIHGIGTGKLKEEVRYLLNSYPNFEFMDEHYTNKGIGATKVFIK
jgi:hypothetical protein